MEKIYLFELNEKTVAVKANSKSQIIEKLKISMPSLNKTLKIVNVSDYDSSTLDYNLTLTKKDLDNFITLTKDTAYNKSYSESHVSFRFSVMGKDDDILLNYHKFIPPFQRDNDKWNKKMQISFVENVLMGLQDTVYIYRLTDDEYTDERFILDGLQRLTAINLFVTNQIKVFDKYYYCDIADKIDSLARIKFKSFRFENEIEAVEFYIQMNENVTHSKKDIQKAKDYLKSLLEEEKKDAK